MDNQSLNSNLHPLITSRKDCVESLNLKKAVKMPDKSTQNKQDPLDTLLSSEYLESINVEDDDGEQGEQPKVMDVQLVMRMFKGIQSQLSVYKKETGLEKLKELEDSVQSQSSDIAELQTQLSSYKKKNALLTGIVRRMSCEVSEMNNRLLELKKHNMRTNLVLTGLEVSGNRNSRLGAVEQFLYQELGIECEVLDAYSIASAATPTVIITVADMQTKFRILANAKKLKGLVNDEGKGFFISEHLPAPMNEDKRRQRELIVANYREEERNQFDMSMKAGKLTIDKVSYKRKVNPPRVDDILALSDDEMTAALQLKLYKGKQILVDGNSFTGFTRSVNSHEEIRLAYIKMKLLHPEA